MSAATIRLIEELAANAWPPAVAQAVDGWRLRFNAGVTRRANSVWPNGAGGLHPLEEKLNLVEATYARWGGPPRYQISPVAHPADLDAVLAGRGYRAVARTCVQTASITAVLERAAPLADAAVSIAAVCDDAWFAAYCQAEHVGAAEAAGRRAILQRIGPLTGYARLELDGQPAAIGLGVLERGWVGVFSLATRAGFRRRGAAMALLRGLAAWGAQRQAAAMYLQVMEQNAPALALYARAGFTTFYHYHYREH